MATLSVGLAFIPAFKGADEEATAVLDLLNGFRIANPQAIGAAKYLWPTATARSQRVDVTAIGANLGQVITPFLAKYQFALTVKFSKWIVDRARILELQRDTDSGSKTFVFQKDKLYIDCGPCLCQIWTAFRICEGAQGPAEALFQLCVRIDDRLPATCCQVSSGTAGLAAVVDQIRSIEMDGPLSLVPSEERKTYRPRLDRSKVQ